MHFQKITLAGVGLLGGSLGLAVKQRSLAKQVAGFVRRQSSVDECKRLDVVDDASCEPLRAAENADLIVLCTPLARMPEVLRTMLPALKPGAIVTDVGSVKAGVVQELEPLVADAGSHFVGSHPMAGAEKTGPGAARADLFVNAVCVITPTTRSSPEAVNCVEEFWRAVGARSLRLSPEAHDELVSRSSHLPHVVAAKLANYVLKPEYPKEQALLCANGFRDTTRIASSSPEMWRDIALANRENLGRVLGEFVEDLREFQHALDAADAKAIEDFFKSARQRRDAWQPPASTSPE